MMSIGQTYLAGLVVLLSCSEFAAAKDGKCIYYLNEKCTYQLYLKPTPQLLILMFFF